MARHGRLLRNLLRGHHARFLGSGLPTRFAAFVGGAASVGGGAIAASALVPRAGVRCDSTEQEWESLRLCQNRLEPPPAQGEILQLWSSTDVSHCSCGPSEVTVMATIKSGIPRETSTRPPVDLVAVIDRSGSMKGSRFDMVRASLKHIVKELHACDRLCLVTFGRDIEVHLGIDYMTSEKHLLAEDVIDSISVRGSTNISDGLIAGLKQLQPTWQPGASSVAGGGEQELPAIVFFTDGCPTDGILDPNQIVKEVAHWRNSTGSVAPVHTFGIGSHCEQLLADLALVTDGMYFPIESSDDIPLAFGQCVGGLLTTTAQHLYLDFLPSADVKLKPGASSTYGWQFVVGNQAGQPPCYRRNLGDMYSGEHRDSLMTLQLPSGSGSTLLGTFSLTYYDALKGEWRQLSSMAVVRRSDSHLPGTQDITVEQQRQRVEVAHALSQAQQLCEGGDFQGAQQTIHSCTQQLEASPCIEDSFAQGLAASLAGATAAVAGSAKFENGGRSYLASNARAHERQRGCGMAGPGGYHAPGGLVGMARATSRVPTAQRPSVERRLAAARPNHANSVFVPPKANARISQDHSKHAEARRQTRTAHGPAGRAASAKPREGSSRGKLPNGGRGRPVSRSPLTPPAPHKDSKAFALFAAMGGKGKK